ncbi:uncharacterized protein [Argopecten irradians]
MHIPLKFQRYTDEKDIRREIEEIRQRIERNTMMNMDIQTNVTAEVDRLRQENMDMAAILDREETFYGHTNIYEEVTRLRCMNLRLKATMDMRGIDIPMETCKVSRRGNGIFETVASVEESFQQKNNKKDAKLHNSDNRDSLVTGQTDDDTSPVAGNSNTNSCKSAGMCVNRTNYTEINRSSGLMATTNSRRFPDQILQESPCPTYMPRVQYHTATVEDAEIRVIFSPNRSNTPATNLIDGHISSTALKGGSTNHDTNLVIPIKLGSSIDTAKTTPLSNVVQTISSDFSNGITEQDGLIHRTIVSNMEGPAQSSPRLCTEERGNKGPVYFKVVSSRQKRPECVPRLDLTALVSKSDIDIAKIERSNVSGCECRPGNDASRQQHKSTQDSRSSRKKTNHLSKKGKSPNRPRKVKKSRVCPNDTQNDVHCIDLSQEDVTIRPDKESHVIKEFLSNDQEPQKESSLSHPSEQTVVEHIQLSPNITRAHKYQPDKATVPMKIHFQARTLYRASDVLMEDNMKSR